MALKTLSLACSCCCCCCGGVWQSVLVTLLGIYPQEYFKPTSSVIPALSLSRLAGGISMAWWLILVSLLVWSRRATVPDWHEEPIRCDASLVKCASCVIVIALWLVLGHIKKSSMNYNSMKSLWNQCACDMIICGTLWFLTPGLSKLVSSNVCLGISLSI